MGKRIIGMAMALVLAAVGTLVLVAYVQGAEARALAGEKTVEVLVVDQGVPMGTLAGSMAGSVRPERVPVKILPDDAVADLGTLDGMVAAVDLVPGETVLASRFVDPATLSSVEVPSGLLEVTVSLTPERALGGHLAAGDTVAVLASLQADVDESEDETAATSDEIDSTHLVLHKVLVTRVQRPVVSNAQQGSTTQADTGESAPQGDLLVTLAVTAPSLETVVFAAEHGSLWLGQEPDDAPEDGTRIVTRENVYR